MKKFTPDLRGGVTPYTAPVIETVEFRTEHGFAASDEPMNPWEESLKNETTWGDVENNDYE